MGHYSDFEEDDEVEEASPLPVIEVKNTEIYEDISQQYEQDYDGYSDSTFDSSDSEDDDNYLQVPQQVRPASQDSISTRVVLLADELIKTEETYVDVLRRGIEGYTKVFKGELPMSLRGRENIIFGNLRRIFEFHAETLLPSLRDCFGDVEKIARVFMKYISEEYFYCYVLYAMNCSRAKKICEDHESFFAKSMEEVGDRLGILSLLLQPIQRIPRYKLLLENILEELGKNIEGSAEVKIPTCGNFSCMEGCYEINLTHQGKFRDFEAFEFHDNDAGRRFRGHVFLFEKCIVYTENKGPDNKPHISTEGTMHLLNLVFCRMRVVLLADELIKTEETYVDVLRRGIEGYTKVFKGELPMSLRGRENIIFGNLRRISEFHAETLLPSLRDCFGDVEKIARVFMKYISEEYFYCYVLYAMNCSRAKKICEDHESFFAKSMEEVGDRLGILSLLLQPIQRIPRYKLLLENILEELGKNIEGSAEVKSQLAETSRAWKAVTKLADCINSSMNVMDITECFEINLTHQGKFRDFEAFEFHDNDAGRRFRGHVFLFEKCIVYTENKGPDNKPTYLYRGHYAFAKLGILQDINRGKISLFRDRLGQKQLDIYGPSPAISKWSDHITHVLMEFANEEKLKNSRGRVNRQSYKSVVPEFRNSTRGSIMSNLSIASSSSGYRSSQSSRDLDLDSRRTTWYENKNLQRLLNSEKHYVSMLYTYKKKLVDHLPEDVRQNIGGYIQCLEAICEMHRDRFLPKLRECDMDVEEICNLFNDFISDGSLGIYMTYATELMSVQQTLLDYNVKFCSKKRLLNSEKHYVSMLYTYKKKLVDHLPEDVRQNIGGYIQCLEAICEMHRDRFLPKLRECDMDVEEICNLFNDFISDGSLGIYMTYATELMSVQQTLLDYNVKFCSKKTQTALMSEDVEAGIKVFLQLPIKRLSAYEAAIHFILECFFSEGINTMSSIFKVAAVLEAELNNLTKSVENNAKVFTCSDFRMSRRSVGFVRYADNVAARAFGTWNYCVLLMERQVVCCKVKQDQESSYFTSVLFHTSYDNLLLRESKLNANRLKFCIKTGDQAVYPLIFRTQDKKQLFMRKFTEFYRHSVTSRK
uniref:DH domain-containing protein n=2 Tax=Lutzomyia longipalpis TaxID=7200 RepID=A0A1B0GKQ6_LUTLO